MHLSAVSCTVEATTASKNSPLILHSMRVIAATALRAVGVASCASRSPLDDSCGCVTETRPLQWPVTNVPACPTLANTAHADRGPFHVIVKRATQCRTRRRPRLLRSRVHIRCGAATQDNARHRHAAPCVDVCVVNVC